MAALALAAALAPQRLQRISHVSNHLLFAAYALLVIGVVVCLAYVAKNFEDEDQR